MVTVSYTHLDVYKRQAMPSTYHFLEKVIDEIVQMYQDAGVELTAFHVGGDEVTFGNFGDVRKMLQPDFFEDITKDKACLLYTSCMERVFFIIICWSQV